MKAILIFFAIIGLGFSAPKINRRDLADDLQEFLELVPIEEILGVIDEHLESDGALAAVVEYLQGPQWRELVDEVGDKPAVQDFLDYLEDAGLPARELIDGLRELIASAEPGAEPDEDGSLRPVLDEIEDLLPVDDLVSLLNDKLQNSPDIQDLYTTISSEDARDLVEEVRRIPEVQRLAQRLRELGVRIDETLALVYDFLGWGRPEPPTGGPSPPTDGPSPPTDGPSPPTDGPSPPTDGPSPPTDGPSPPTDGPSPPTDGPEPPTDGPSPPTDGPEPPTDGPSPPTDGPEPPTDGPSPPTDGPEPPTDGPTQPTDGPEPPTDGPSPPTDGPEPPTDETEPPTDEPDTPVTDRPAPTEG